MKTIIRGSIIAASLALALVSHAATWNVDPAHSVISFAVKHMMISTVRGTFNTFQGTVNYDEKQPDTFSIEATVDAASIDTRVAQRDTHLKSADFFDVEKFPKLAFKSKSVKKIGDGHYTMAADLTIRDVTKEVTFDVTGLQGTITDPQGHVRTAAVATTTINREDFGLHWNKALEGGGVLVGDDVNITLDVELVKQDQS